MMCKGIQEILSSLGKYKFKSSFKLTKKDIEYMNRLGITKIESRARDFIIKRIALNNIKMMANKFFLKSIMYLKLNTRLQFIVGGYHRKWYNMPKGRSFDSNVIEFI